MIRYVVLTLVILATAASAIAAAMPPAGHAVSATGQTAPAAVTVVMKNSPFPVVSPIEVEACALEDCSEVDS